MALYHALMESILEDEDAMDKGVAEKSKKRNPDDANRDEGPHAGSNQGLKRKKTRKDAELSKKAKPNKTSKGTTKSHPKSTNKSTQAEETVFQAGDTQVRQNLGNDMGNTDEPPIVNVDPKDWFKKPERPPTPDPKWNESKTVDNKPTQKWLSDLAKAEKSSKMFDDLMITLINFSAFVMNRLQISDLTQDILVGLAYKILKGTCRSYVELEYNMEECYKALTDQLDWNNPEGTSHWRSKRQTFYRYASNRVSKHDVYSTKRILEVTNVKVNVWYGYGHLEEIEFQRSDQKLYKFMEGDFSRLYLNDIEDLPLLVFSDGTLISVRDKLKDMANNLEMRYTSVMPRRRWSNLDKKWSRTIKKDIDR
ncbi:hypothetical protein Tco_0216112 [Tanacetum coccineum]